MSTPGSSRWMCLHAVAVVDVEVEVEDAPARVARPRDGERRVVVDAEAAGPVGHGVVEAAAGVERVVRVAAQDRLGRPDRAAGNRRARLVHAREGRIVAGPDTRPARTVGVRRDPPDRRDVGAPCGGAAGRRPEPAPGRGPARHPPNATGRSPARTGAASAGGTARSHRCVDRGPIDEQRAVRHVAQGSLGRAQRPGGRLRNRIADPPRPDEGRTMRE